MTILLIWQNSNHETKIPTNSNLVAVNWNYQKSKTAWNSSWRKALDYISNSLVTKKALAKNVTLFSAALQCNSLKNLIFTRQSCKASRPFQWFTKNQLIDCADNLTMTKDKSWEIHIGKCTSKSNDKNRQCWIKTLHLMIRFKTYVKKLTENDEY